MLSDIDLLELISAKFCHDLAGPLGVISHGLDFLNSEDAAMKEKSIDLIKYSSDKSVASLKLFRILYGTVKPVGEANLSDLRNIIGEYFSSTKIKLDWPDDHLFVQGYSINNRVAKLIISLIFASSSILINKGLISVRLNPSKEGCQINIEVSDQSIKNCQQYVQALSKDAINDDVNYKNINFYLIKRFADFLGVEPIVEIKDKQVNFIVNLTKNQL
jgi:histidine phosphotransferase ChpT